MKRILLVIGLFPLYLGLNAQQSYDYGVFLGATGDHLFNILPVYNPLVKVTPGAYFRYNLNPRYAIRGGVNLGLDPANQFIPSLIDGYGLFEFNFHALNPKRENAKISPYIGTGISYMVDRDLTTLVMNSLQSRSVIDYFLRNINIPFNLGFRYNATPSLTLSAEWALRKRFEKDYTNIKDPIINFNKANWRSHIGLMIGYSIPKTCKTCPFYEKERSKKLNKKHK